MSKNAKRFSPKDKAASTAAKAIQANPDLIASLSSESYKHAVSSVSRLLDPESGSNETVTTFQESGATGTVFRPKIVKDINVGPSGLWRVLAYPRFYRPVAMTDYTRLADGSYSGYRDLSLTPTISSSRLQPPGRPTSIPPNMFASGNRQTVPALEMLSSDAESMILPEWDDTFGCWLYDFGFEDAFVTSLRIESWNTPVPVVEFCEISGGGTRVVTPVIATSNNMGFIATQTAVATTRKFGYRLVSTSTPFHAIGMVVNVITPVVSEEILWFDESSIVPTVQDAASSFYVQGMSAWIQYTGADLVNGGEISGYRFPADSYVRYGTLASTFQELSSTPGALVGQIKEGAYGFYLPQSAREMGYLPLESYQDFGYLFFAGKKNSADASIRLNFNQFLSVLTTNQAFAKNVFTADPEGWSAAISILKNVQPVIKNDRHQEKIRKVLSQLRSYAPKIKQGLSTTAQIVKYAAPLVASLLA